MTTEKHELTVEEQKIRDLQQLVADLFILIDTSSRWFHDSTLWEDDSYDNYLPPQWKEIRERAYKLGAAWLSP